ncbi:MAG: lasso peptide biosynthesis B2 protein [Pseudomonadota bacterium]
MSKSADGLRQRAGRLSARQWKALLTATWLLAKARYEHHRKPIKAVLQRFETTGSGSVATAAEADLIGWAVSSAGSRVPWRSDCLLQAMAGSMWLDRVERGYKLNVGVRKNATGELEAHAWLTSGDLVVTGKLSDLKEFSPMPLESGISEL